MFNWHNEAAKKWDEKADFWNQSSKDMWEHGSRSTIIPFIKEHIPAGNVLDAGCGDGYGSLLLHKEGYQVTGIDLSGKMVEKAKLQDTNENVQFMEADIAKMPFPNDTFDAVMAINSFEWVNDPLMVLKEFSRVLTESGYACIGLLGPTAAPRHNSYVRLYGEDVICNTMMPWELEKLATENGFKLVNGHGVYKRGVTEVTIKGLSDDLRQALSFMWVFIFQKESIS
ncbi:class I SAM-dependent methyltransferase [Bacillus pinisoli]|uniref:class I SAM-dependent methyltransferase n=1 Tax=Bacillus pinisoli TaxID=2901866 RepID=UPI001FF29464|nr:class I SAM-dependent methyltransferase [Bacillus pinisoli]